MTLPFCVNPFFCLNFLTYSTFSYASGQKLLTITHNNTISTGHGGYVLDEDNDEDDGYDETIVPVDFATNGQICDDDLYQTLVCALPAGASLVSVMDCCHSGTVLDLPYKYKATGSGWSGITSSGPPSSGGKCSLQTILGILALICVAFVIVVTVHYFIAKSV